LSVEKGDEGLQDTDISRPVAPLRSQVPSEVPSDRIVWLITDDAGAVRWVQPSWCAYTGQTADAASGHGWSDAFDRRDRATIIEHWNARVAERAPFALVGRVWNQGSQTFRSCAGQVVPIENDGAVVHWVVTLTEVHADDPEHELERAMADRFRRIFDANVFGIGYGHHDRIVGGNEAFLAAVGATEADLRDGIPFPDIFGVEDATVAAFTDGAAREYELRRVNGTSGHVLAAGVSLTPDAGWLAFTVDLTSHKVAERAMAHLALHDPLTGLPNRRLLQDRLQHALSGSHRQAGTVAVLFCDVDYFKNVNDSHGHRGGDAVLQTVARRLETVVRDNDTVARAGGDEFVVVLENLVDPTEATRIAERARVAVNEPISFDRCDFRITVSVGVSLNADPHDNVESLLRRADDALYRAKRRGRDRIAFAEHDVANRHDT
jgi:diguanylate cyclase (GGDEF)-like protein